ncbi:MAG: hypothetical protein L6Q84_02870 [Polyangiaceae bacterium]|nr:hypothetical protein [Polyangiaceae bacterium]
MAKKVEAPVPINKRGSPEAIAKRRSARAFNELLDPAGSSRLDGRTEQRRRRLLAELESGKTRGSGRPLKPVDVLSHVTELLELGESAASIRKVCRPRPAPSADARLLETLGRLHRAYGFPKEAYAFLGITEEVLKRAGVVGPPAKRRRAET